MTETLNTRALNMVIARAIEAQDAEVKTLLGGAIKSYEDYRHRVGVINGLQKVRAICEDVERDLYGRK